MKRRFTRSISVLTAVTTLSATAFGRPPERVRKVVEAIELGTAAYDGDGHTIQMAERLTIERMGTSWVRLRIGEFQLGEDSFITISSPLDGRMQRHTASSLVEWERWTAIFNGDAVDVVQLLGGDGGEGGGFGLGRGVRGRRDGDDDRKRERGDEQRE